MMHLFVLDRIHFNSVVSLRSDGWFEMVLGTILRRIRNEYSICNLQMYKFLAIRMSICKPFESWEKTNCFGEKWWDYFFIGVFLDHQNQRHTMRTSTTKCIFLHQMCHIQHDLHRLQSYVKQINTKVKTEWHFPQIKKEEIMSTVKIPRQHQLIVEL